jgi:DNA-binding MarR family transcriptional regulator
MVYESTEAVYQFLKDYIRKHNFPPTVREIGDACHLSRSTVTRNLDRLEALGRITRQPGKARSITLTDGK